MKNKATISLGVIFFFLVIIYFMTTYHPPEVTKGAVPLFEGNKPDIDRIEVTDTRGVSLILVRQDGLWYMEEPFEFKAYDRYVNNFITMMQNTVIDGIVSSRVDARSQFAVDDSTGFALKVSSGDNVVFDGIIGKYASDIGHCYVRRRGSNDIELWRGILSQEVRRNANEWRDRSIYSINQDDILRIEAVEGEVTRTLRFEDSVWVYTEEGVERQVDNTRVRSLVGYIANLNAEDFADENDIQQVITRDYDIEVTFTVRNGDEHTYHLWRPTESYARWLMRERDGDLLYRFYAYNGTRLSIDYGEIETTGT
ncbi:DUF4340 domain-containing protein [Candidatus Latescibacterota bacterium]